jgi:hypothetical protein
MIKHPWNKVDADIVEIRLARGKLVEAGGWDNGDVLVPAAPVRPLIERAERLADEVEYLREGLTNLRGSITPLLASSTHGGLAAVALAECESLLS